MKKAIIIISLLSVALVFSAVAQDKETTSVLSGTVSLVLGEDGQYVVMLTLENGDTVVVDLPAGEAERLKLRDRDRLRVRGVFVGAVPDSGLGARILARTMTRNLRTLTVKEPVQLTERDRLQIRDYESYVEGQDGSSLQTRTRTQERAQTETQARDRSSGGTPSAGDSTGAGKP